MHNVLNALDEMKAEDVISIDLRGKTALADEMSIATGRSTVHVGAIADKAMRALKDAGVSARVEGLPQCDWVLIDAGDGIHENLSPVLLTLGSVAVLMSVGFFANLGRPWLGLEEACLRGVLSILFFLFDLVMRVYVIFALAFSVVALVALLKEAGEALNGIPKRTINGDRKRTTYGLAYRIEAALKGMEGC